MFELLIETNFSAAHNLRNYKGKCENVHGHNWKVQIILESASLDNLGMVMDFRDIKKIMDDILERYDHKYLNQLDTFSIDNPTTENLSRLLYQEMRDKLPEDISVKKVTTWESEGCGASYYECDAVHSQ